MKLLKYIHLSVYFYWETDIQGHTRVIASYILKLYRKQMSILTYERPHIHINTSTHAYIWMNWFLFHRQISGFTHAEPDSLIEEYSTLDFHVWAGYTSLPNVRAFLYSLSLLRHIFNLPSEVETQYQLSSDKTIPLRCWCHQWRCCVDH